MNIAVVSVFVSDPIAAHQYYTETLGFDSQLFLPEHYVAIVCEKGKKDSTGILLEPNMNPIAKNYQDALWEANLPCITFGSKDILKEYEELKAKGVKFRGEPKQTEWGTEVVFEDGFGNMIQLAQLITP